MGGSSRTGRIAATTLLVGALFVTAAYASGCATRDAASTEQSAPQEKDPDVLGPYPLGVDVTLGTVTITLESVSVSDSEWPSSVVTGTATPEGQRWVSATFAFTGPGANPVPAGGHFHSGMALIVDGVDTPIGELSTVWDGEAPPGVTPRGTFTFLVPEGARSVVLQLVPKLAETETVAFRLW